MHFIVFDLEFNQAMDLSNNAAEDSSSATRMRLPFEILQIGAVKLDQELHTVAAFNRLVKPTLHTTVSPFITELTGITTGQVDKEERFPEVYPEFTGFIGDTDSVFCVWGKTDVKELFRNVSYHSLDKELLPKRYINIQPYASLQLGQSKKKLPRLKNTVEALDIPITFPFHDAGNDAHYTAEIFKKLYRPSMQPKVFEPDTQVHRPRTPRRMIDFDMLLQQFEKMYGREMTDEEKGMIRLAYQMGKTHQFLKEV
jgi:DNA polymerase III epsilon subunit-like protein